jgi:hypothetical protein
VFQGTVPSQTSNPLNRSPGLDSALTESVIRNTLHEEVTSAAGDYFRGAYLGRGSAACDFDNDGAVDFAVSNLDRPIALLRNVQRARGRSIGFKCSGTVSNRNGVNTELTLDLDRRTLVRQVIGGGSYQSAPDYRVLVGTDQSSVVSRLEVSWSSGRQDTWENVPAGGLYLICEGRPPRWLAPWNGAENVQP